jgi:hypothetical protein
MHAIEAFLVKILFPTGDIWVDLRTFVASGGIQQTKT